MFLLCFFLRLIGQTDRQTDRRLCIIIRMCTSYTISQIITTYCTAVNIGQAASCSCNAVPLSYRNCYNSYSLNVRILITNSVFCHNELDMANISGNSSTLHKFQPYFTLQQQHWQCPSMHLFKPLCKVWFKHRQNRHIFFLLFRFTKIRDANSVAYAVLMCYLQSTQLCIIWQYGHKLHYWMDAEITCYLPQSHNRSLTLCLAHGNLERNGQHHVLALDHSVGQCTLFETSFSKTDCMQISTFVIQLCIIHINTILMLKTI